MWQKTSSLLSCALDPLWEAIRGKLRPKGVRRRRDILAHAYDDTYFRLISLLFELSFASDNEIYTFCRFLLKKKILCDIAKAQTQINILLNIN